MARPRRHPLDRRVPSRRPHQQGTSARTHHTHLIQARPLPAPRQPARVPRKPVIMPTSSTPPRTRSPPAQGSSALPPTTCRDYPEVGISPIIPMSELCDNYATHKHDRVQAWLGKHPPVPPALHPDLQLVAEPGIG